MDERFGNSIVYNPALGVYQPGPNLPPKYRWVVEMLVNVVGAEFVRLSIPTDYGHTQSIALYEESPGGGSVGIVTDINEETGFDINKTPSAIFDLIEKWRAAHAPVAVNGKG